MNWKTWLKGAAAALLGAAAGGAAQAIAAGATSPKQIGTGAVAGAVLLLGGYLKAAPGQTDSMKGGGAK